MTRILERDHRSPAPVARASLPTRHGLFQVTAYADSAGREHAAFVCGDVEGRDNVPVRVHSECLTGDVFASLRCDCRQQLETSLEYVQRQGLGVVLYLRQEGRGIGLGNKIRAYMLQEAGMDTNQANLALGFRADERTYDAAAELLRRLGVRSVQLLSNNLAKMEGLREHGIDVVGLVPVIVPPNPRNQRYLRTKLESGHLLHGAFGLDAPGHPSHQPHAVAPFEDFSDTKPSIARRPSPQRHDLAGT